jgi:hypothetical protein
LATFNYGRDILALTGALQIARQAATGAVIVTILPDSGDKYLSEHFWEQTT